MQTTSCPICNKEFKQLTAQHIFKHGLTVVEFRLKYPTTFLGNRNQIEQTKSDKQKRIEDDNIRCVVCHTLISTPDRKRNRFCSHSCSAKHFHILKVKKNHNCLSCNKEYFTKNSRSKYCSLKCQQDFKYSQYISFWKNNQTQKLEGGSVSKRIIRRYMFEKYNNQCSKCGWNSVNPITNKIPLEVEHIDGNYLNNNENNLTLLCPNCHSLTPTYKGLNKGKGRHFRRMRYQENKSY